MPVISDVVLANGQPINGAVVNAYKASRFGGIPAYNAAAPGAADAGPVVSGTAFGGAGQFQITVPTSEGYYLGVTVAASTAWQFYDYAAYDSSANITTTGTVTAGTLSTGGNLGVTGNATVGALTTTGALTAGTTATSQSVGAPATATSGTIATAGLGVSRVAPAGAITSVILASGTTPGQQVVVVNQSAFSITFAASGTSHVADGVSDVIAAQTARGYVWNSITALWYRLG